MGIVAFDMNLFAHEVDQPVFTAGRLVNGGCHIAQLTLSPDFPEIDGKDPRQLFDFPVNRRDLTVKQPGNIPLKEIGIGNKDPAQLEVDNQSG